MQEKLIFEHSREGRIGCVLPKCDVHEKETDSLIPKEFLRNAPLDLPELGELDVVRHYTRLSQKNVGVDTVFYPLGSCTMKYNPKINEKAASYPNFTQAHPLQPIEK